MFSDKPVALFPGDQGIPQYGITDQSLIPMRREASEQSEMLSQLLFGEYYQVTAYADRWLKVISLFDNHCGWIDAKLFLKVSETEFQLAMKEQQPVLNSVLAVISGPSVTSMLIPAGSYLPGLDSLNNTFKLNHHIYRIRYPFDTFNISVSLTALKFMHCPYLWGGRSPFGFDCSGFVQVVYKMKGMALKRDATDQAGQGEKINTTDEIREGDLAFFINAQGEIYHVGIALAPGSIIHCSGSVRVDKLDENGIFNVKMQQYTHRLSHIMRIIP
jgi:hypothetical protein